MFKRVIWIILDSVGIGELPDAEAFGDKGSNTLENLHKLRPMKLPNLTQLGLGNIQGVTVLDRADCPIGAYGKMAETSNGKDTTMGHWEMAGVHSANPFPTFPNGFPRSILDPFEAAINHTIIGNKAASGTDILVELGEQHMQSGCPIVYTSADSVFQIACHESIIPIDKLYEMCHIARQILTGENALARVIARPFTGSPGNFQRTPNRRDFSLVPPHDTLLDIMKNADMHVIGIGKIEDIFCEKGITEAIHTISNDDGMAQTLQYMSTHKEGLIFTNLVDFDSKWGHRNDIEGYASGLESFDNQLVSILEQLDREDLLIINADHGCDPTTPSTDHSREYVPLIVYSKQFTKGLDLGIRSTFADVGQTIADNFKIDALPNGTSFLDELKHII